MKNWSLLFAGWVGFLMLMVSCERRPLIEPDGNTILKVHLVTEGINNVTCHIYNEHLNRPEITSDNLRMFLYEKEGYPLIAQKFISDKTIDERGYETLSGRLPIPEGVYGLLTYNFDVDATYVTEEGNFHTARAYTHEIPTSLYSRFGSRAESFDHVYYQPEHVMVAAEPALRVEEHHEDQVVEMDAHTVIQTYYIQIRIKGHENLAPDAAAQAILSGLSQSVLLKDGTSVKEPAAIYFELQRGKDAQSSEKPELVLCALFNTFGRIDQIPSELQVTFSALGRSGKTHQKVVDMVPVFETEDARLRNWLLIEEVWEIPTEIGGSTGGGGFGPMVNDWEDIEVTIPIKK